jgi:hypothetical protein
VIANLSDENAIEAKRIRHLIAPDDLRLQVMKKGENAPFEFSVLCSTN